ncbi:MAG: ABC transporter ATP-binding protein [Candidatus Roizmanbacteria bacterium]
MIELHDIWKEYQINTEEKFIALKGITLKVDAGEFVAITGPSGCGKSTCMQILGLLDKPTKGKVIIGKREAENLSDNELSRYRNEYIGFVFQQFNLINKLTILENVLVPTLYTRKKLTYNPKEYGAYLLERFGLTEKSKSYPNKISGGQQQRVAIARSLIMKPEFILADEPTGNLDTKTGDEIMRLFTELNTQDKITIVVVTHESDIAARAQRQIKMKDGQIFES